MNIYYIWPKLNLFKNLEVDKNLAKYFCICFLHWVKRKSQVSYWTFRPHQHFCCHVKIPRISNWLWAKPFTCLLFYLIINRFSFLLFCFGSFFPFFLFISLDILLRSHSWNINYCGILLFNNPSELVLFGYAFDCKVDCVRVLLFFKNVSILLFC